MRIILVINPRSGKGDTTSKMESIHRACREAGHGYEVLTIGPDRSVEHATREILRERPDRVLICGGDGTVTAVGTALLHTGIPLGVLPCGTANAIARAIGVPARLTEATRYVLEESPRPFDAVRINDRISLLTSGAGYDSDIVATADGQLKKKIGPLAYIWAFFAKLGSLQATRFEITIDDRDTVTVEGHCLLLANIGRLFGEFDLFLDSRPDDGLVNVAVLRLEDIQELVSVAGRTLTGIEPGSMQSAFFAGRNVTVRLSQRLRTQIDGDVGGETDSIRAEVLPGALQVVRRDEPRRPLFQVPGWIESVADSLMGSESRIERAGD